MAVVNRKIIANIRSYERSYSAFLKEYRYEQDKVIVYTEKRKAISKEQ